MKKCKLEGCEKKHHAKGLCYNHYFRQYRYGTTDLTNNYHYMTESHEHNVWRGMRYRCENPKNKSYKYYGGKGIKVCERWKNSFMNFYNDLGPAPSEKHQIDRINPAKDYDPGNCRWLTAKENSRRCSNTILNMDDAKNIRKKKSNGESTGVLATEYGVSRTTIYNIINCKSWN